MSVIRDKIVAQIAQIEDLPVQGHQFLETRDLLKAQSQDASAVARIIEKDLWLTARVLKTANSVYYASRYGEIGSLQQAVARLGMEEVLRIGLAFKAMNIFPSNMALINQKDFWNHSIAVAMVTRALAGHASGRSFDPEEAYIAGLLHDVGQIILDRYFSTVYERVRGMALENGTPLYKTEEELLDIEHGEIGGMVLARWKYPQSIIEAVSWHNAPDRATPENRTLVQLVHLADFACAALGASEPGDLLPQNSSESAWYDLNINTEQIQSIIGEVQEEIERTRILFNML